VGKTTTAAATALCAARRGQRALVVSAAAARGPGGDGTGGAEGLGSVLQRRLSSRATRVATRLDAVEIDTRGELKRHWSRAHSFFASLFRAEGIDEIVAEELALLPGAEELATLLAVREHAERGSYDLVVVDCTPADAALRLLTFPRMSRGAPRFLLHVQRAIATAIGPLARGVLSAPLPEARVFRDIDTLFHRAFHALYDLLVSPETTVRLVLTPDASSIAEARRAHTDLCLFSLGCDAVVLNHLYPPAAAREPFFRAWWSARGEHEAEVAELFAPLPVLRGLLQEQAISGLEPLGRFAEGLFEGREPAATLSEGPRVRFRSADTGFIAEIPLPHAREAKVGLIDGEVLVTHEGARRRVRLPRSLASLPLEGADYRDNTIVLRFREDRGALCM
ncbi:MAG: TRC40/GET3/ArsA family transport-energizing ATPase, partial [Myxococcales bacterium]|nr:TRC40/GET3/ArsA family transport-energizing ATPase [Myxococcales bacterium]